MTEGLCTPGEIKMVVDDIISAMRKQRPQAVLAKSIIIDCICGKRVSITAMYKCHHCGIYFCRECGKNHFGEDKTGLVGSYFK